MVSGEGETAPPPVADAAQSEQKTAKKFVMAQTIAHSGSELHGASIHGHHELSFLQQIHCGPKTTRRSPSKLFSTLFFMVVGGLLAMGVTYQLAFLEYQCRYRGIVAEMAGDRFRSFLTRRLQCPIHDACTVMIFLVVMPLWLVFLETF